MNKDKSIIFDLQMFAVPVQPDVSNTINYTATDLTNEAKFGKLLEPGLRKLFFETYDELSEQYSKIYNIEKSSKASEHDWGMGAFGDWTKRASQLDSVAYKTLSPGLERTYIHEAFTQGFMVTREMFDDDQYRQINKMPKAMARSGRAKVEKDAMLPLINGFDKTLHPIYDKEALFSAVHPLLDSVSTCSNLATGPLSDINLKNALKMMRETVDEAGGLVEFKPTKLIVPPALEDTAVRILNSSKVVGGNFNDTNEYLNNYGIQIVVMDYLSAAAGGSDTAWFLQDGSKHEMNFFWRCKPEFKWEEEFDDFVSKYRGYMRYSCGVSDWRGIIGSTGL